MPAHGDQHKQQNGNTSQNPFEEQKPVISAYTAQEIATLSSRLNKRLGPEYIATRAGPGNTRVAYLSAEKAINLANEVFGFNGWSSSIQNIQIDFVDENPTKGTISIGLSVVVRVTLKDGTYHEDTGYGGIENCKSKIAAFEKAKKEGTTDALKRALRNFGNVLGNCIYDKEYITKVSKIKAGTGKWDVNDLYRHGDFVPKKEEQPAPPPVTNIPPQQPPSLIPEESFDVTDFDDADLASFDNPDEIMLPPDTGVRQKGAPPQQPNSRPPANHQMTPSKPPQNRPSIQPERQHHPVQASARQPPHVGSVNGGTDHNQQPLSRSSSPGIPSQHFGEGAVGPASVGFFSARAAEALDGSNRPTGSTPVQKFNPYAEARSIRKTSGVDHSKSVALNKTTLKPEPPIVRDEQGQIAGQQKPAIEQRRSLGPSAGGFSPVSAARVGGGMTSAYRPPTRHGAVNTGSNSPVVPTSAERAATKRAPLSDLSNVQHNANGTSSEGNDPKRQRVGPGLSGNTDQTLPPG